MRGQPRGVREARGVTVGDFAPAEGALFDSRDEL